MRMLLIPTFVLTTLTTVTTQAATIMVTSPEDIGPGTFREAVALARDGDQIEFDPALSGTIIRLASSEVFIDRDLTISGLGRDRTILAGRPWPSGCQTEPQRLLSIGAGATVRLSGLTLREGSAGTEPAGGAILNLGTLTLSDSSIEENFSCELSAGRGAGIYNMGDLRMSDTLVRGNAAGGGGGGLFNAVSGHADIQSSQFLGNSSYDPGGAISNFGELSIDRGILGGNRTNRSGAGLVNYGTALLHQTLVAGNDAQEMGGGVLSYGDLLIDACTLSGNFAELGGSALRASGETVVVNSSVHSNSTWNHSTSGTVTNGGRLLLAGVTITGNRTGGGFGGSVPGVENGRGGSAVVKGSVILGNLSICENCAADPVRPSDCRGSFTSGGYNLIGSLLGTDYEGNESVICQGFEPESAGDTVGLDVREVFEWRPDPSWPSTAVAILADNGGPTSTIALLPGSPAIDRLPPAECADPADYGLTSDQRGVPRPQGEGCDAGAFEFSPPRDRLFWEQQCREKQGAEYDAAQLTQLLAIVGEMSPAFPECVGGSCAALEPDGPRSSWEARAGRELLAVWLNLASGRLTLNRPVDLPGMSGTTTVRAAVSDIEATVCRASASREELAEAASLAKSLNDGGSRR